MVNEHIARNFEKARKRLERLSQLRADKRLSIELSSKVITESRELITRLDALLDTKARFGRAKP
jgi:hypothetical protein